MPSYSWDQLNSFQIGKYAEYYVKMEFTSYGFDVYSSEVDDKGIDFIVKKDNGLYYEIQVKSVRKSNYVFALKDRFHAHRDNVFMALVLFINEELPELYLIPSKEWLKPNDLLRDREYQGKKSSPEWGINISKKNRPLLKQYEFNRIIQQL